MAAELSGLFNRKDDGPRQIIVDSILLIRGAYMKWLIGIDGGGTKTVGFAASLDGTVLGRVEYGPANYHTVGTAAVGTVVIAIAEALSRQCVLAMADLRLICLGLAGADSPLDCQILRQSLAACLDSPFVLYSDAQIALAAGLGKPEGIVLIAGTGSIAYGIDAAGRSVRAGGWGQLASDEGSGFAIGRAALRAAIRAAEQRAPQTVLLPMILDWYGLKNWDELIVFINNYNTGKAKIAELAKVTAEAAEAGDGVAAGILCSAGDELAGLVLSVINRGFSAQSAIKVCTYGSIINKIVPVRRQTCATLAGRAELTAPEREPAEGALLLGIQYLQGEGCFAD